jgi:hypothetical protein
MSGIRAGKNKINCPDKKVSGMIASDYFGLFCNVQGCRYLEVAPFYPKSFQVYFGLFVSKVLSKIYFGLDTF